MRNFADRLLEKIDELKSPICVGLDPRPSELPGYLKDEAVEKFGNTREAVAYAFLEFNKKIIDATSDIVPAYKPQNAFYEQYGHQGVQSLEGTIEYIRSKGRIAIEDAKRNDIKETAQAYADGHLGSVELLDGRQESVFNADAMTVNPYLGSDGIKPFVDVCKRFGKGIFVLAKTSNASSGELQDLLLDPRHGSNRTVFEQTALNIDNWGREAGAGDSGYYLVGAVVGATYPEQAKRVRELAERSIILVPGYGAQGAMGIDTIHSFNVDGQGAIVNSARGIIFAYQKGPYKKSEDKFEIAAREAAIAMQEDITSALGAARKSRW